MTIRVEDLTIGQKAALDTIVQMSHRPRGGIPETCVIAGPAGTGKTTLLKMVCDEIGTSHIVAPTGKAALRVKQATGYPATTIHKLLFKPVKNQQTGEIDFVLKEPHEIGTPESGFLISDESSMIDEQLHDSMMAIADAVNLKVLFLGDLAQLPPVTPPGKRPFNILDPKLYEATYRADLTEIVRQAAGRPADPDVVLPAHEQGPGRHAPARRRAPGAWWTRRWPSSSAAARSSATRTRSATR
jgi:hypothetical protein